MDNFTILDSVSELALESEKISSQLAHFDKTRKQMTQSQDFEISPWSGVYDILQSIERDNALQGEPKGKAEKQAQLIETPKIDLERISRVIYSVRRNKHNKILSPISTNPKRENKKLGERAIFRHALDVRKGFNYEEISQEYPSMLMTPDSMSTDNSSGPIKSKFELKRRSHMSLTQKVLEVPRISSFTDINSYHQRLPALHEFQPLKNIENTPKMSNLLKIISSPTETKIHISTTKSEHLAAQAPKKCVKTPTPRLHVEKSKFLSKQNIILNIQEPKNSMRALPIVKTKFFKL
ncbi:unnamed protein product [Blepharisma stoltei]|uniref:Uncharacterized protein n=1 Tax=Blepharisma stoltei TaxID=1481888 RepID=A0AAU9IRR3_9CILI|nr:unnamed protein product [Blepharisma stoltei]